MNAANEVAVQRFIDGKLRFIDIADFVADAMAKASYIATPSLEDLFACDAEVRIMCESLK